MTGWFRVGSGAGSMLLPWLIGQIFVRTGQELYNSSTYRYCCDCTGPLLFASQRTITPIEQY